MTSLRMVTAALLFAFMLAPAPAWAGCEKDTDCKGDRVCENGACVAPSGARMQRERRARTPETTATVRLTMAKWRTIASLVLAPIGLIGGVTGAVVAATLEDDDVWPVTFVPVGIGFVSLAAAGGVGGHAGILGGDGLRHLGRATDGGSALAIAGWAAWGVGMATLAGSLIAIGVINDDVDDRAYYDELLQMRFGENEAVPIIATAVVGSVLASAGAVLLGVDALSESQSLDDALQEQSTADAPSFRVAVAPAERAKGGTVVLRLDF
jgi:hypothetical protein